MGVEKPQFSVGDRVQVTDEWFSEEIRGAKGTIIDTPHGLPPTEIGIYWVEFDDMQGGNIDSAEIDADFLRRI